MSAVGRNSACPCGAKKPNGEPIKYKSCCLAKEEAQRKPHTGEDAVIICMPTRGAVSHETLVSIEQNLGGIKHAIIRVARKPVDEARNILAKTALEVIEKRPFAFTPRETFILWLDDDAMLLPGVVKQMINAMHDLPKLDALFAWFSTRAPFAKPVAFRRLGDGESFPKPGVDCKPGDVVPIEAAGFHSAMMRPRLLQRIGPDPFTPNRDDGEDIAFCRRAKAIGAFMAVGTALPSPHVDPRDGTCYLPGTGTLICDGNALRNLGNDHLAGDGSLKSSEIRGYGLNAAESATAKADAARTAAMLADMEQRRAISAV